MTVSGIMGRSIKARGGPSNTPSPPLVDPAFKGSLSLS